MAVSVVGIAMIVPNADRIIICIQEADFVLKSAVMVKGTPQDVMMETTLIMMDAARIVKFKLDSLVMEAHLAARIPVPQYYLLKSHSKIEDSQDYLERLLSTLRSTTFLRRF